MSKAANIPRGKRNKNQCNSSPTDAYKVFINPNDGLKRIGWSFLAISSIMIMDNKANKKAIGSEELEKVSGGEIALPSIPGIPYVTIPGGEEKQDEPKDGGATYTW